MRVNRRVKLNIDQRGKIKCGYKTEKGLPKSTFHFAIVHPETGETNFPELVELYGSEPTSIFITFPSNNIEDFFNDDYSLWQGNNTKRRTCNGETCTHIIEESILGVKYQAGTETECVCIKHGLFDTEDKDLKKLKCKCDVYLKAWILHPKTLKPISPTCYLFENHSANSADNIYGEFMTPDGQRKWAQLMGFPFVLSVKKVKKADNTSYPILNLYPYIPTDRLIDYSRAMALDVQGQIEDSVNDETDATKLLDNVNQALDKKEIFADLKRLFENAGLNQDNAASKALRTAVIKKYFNIAPKDILSAIDKLNPEDMKAIYDKIKTLLAKMVDVKAAEKLNFLEGYKD